jgi:hypothetical protein
VIPHAGVMVVASPRHHDRRRSDEDQDETNDACPSRTVHVSITLATSRR